MLYPPLKLSSPDPPKVGSTISAASSEMPSLTVLSKACLYPNPLCLSPCPLAPATSEGTLEIADFFVCSQPRVREL